MAYFSNGTEGMAYEERYCERCVHRNGPDGKSGCAVWLAHLLYAYKLCNSEEEGKQILEILIPTNKDNFAAQCSMFHAGDAVPEPGSQQHAKPTVMPAMREWAQKRGLPC